MPDAGRADVHAALWLRQRWGRVYDTGWAAGEWHAFRLDGGGDLISAASPAELDALLQELQDRPPTAAP